MRINEDAFSIQIRDVSGVVHSFRKQDLEDLEKVFGEQLINTDQGWGSDWGGDVIFPAIAFEEATQ